MHSLVYIAMGLGSLTYADPVVVTGQHLSSAIKPDYDGLCKARNHSFLGHIPEKAKFCTTFQTFNMACQPIKGEPHYMSGFQCPADTVCSTVSLDGKARGRNHTNKDDLSGVRCTRPTKMIKGEIGNGRYEGPFVTNPHGSFRFYGLVDVETRNAQAAFDIEWRYGKTAHETIVVGNKAIRPPHNTDARFEFSYELPKGENGGLWAVVTQPGKPTPAAVGIAYSYI